MSHAMLYIASSIDDAELPSEIAVAGVDVEHEVIDNFGIKEARSLRDRAYRTPISHPYRTFVIAFQTITNEAQNALLKLLEEPPATTRFFVVIPHESLLLPTVRSRLQLVSKTDFSKQQEFTDSFRVFLKQSYAERLSAIASNTKDKNTDWIKIIKDGVLHWVTEHQDVPVDSRQKLFLTAELVGTRGASNKILLEEIALLLPVGQ